MIYIFIVIAYVVIVVAHAFAKEYKEQSIRIDCIAFSFWKGSLNGPNGEGYPRKPSGAWMTYWEVHDYWNEKVDKKKWILHATKGNPTINKKK